MKEKHFILFDSAVILISSSKDSSIQLAIAFAFLVADSLVWSTSGIGLIQETIFAALESRWVHVLLLYICIFTAREVAGNNLRVHFFSQTVWESCQSLCGMQRETAVLLLALL